MDATAKSRARTSPPRTSSPLPRPRRRLVYSAEDDTPSYLEGAATAWAGENPEAGTAVVGELPSGTWWFRVQAIRVTDLGKFVVAETSPTPYTVP